jgi:predicted DNA binding protein
LVQTYKKHGYDVTTVILKECETNEEVKKWGLYYSKLWNIVENKSWANLIPESGEGSINVIKDKTILGIKNTLDKRKNRHAVNQAKFSARRSFKGSKKRELLRSKLTLRQCQTLHASPRMG